MDNFRNSSDNRQRDMDGHTVAQVRSAKGFINLSATMISIQWWGAYKWKKKTTFGRRQLPPYSPSARPPDLAQALILIQMWNRGILSSTKIEGYPVTETFNENYRTVDGRYWWRLSLPLCDWPDQKWLQAFLPSLHVFILQFRRQIHECRQGWSKMFD